MDPTDHRYRKSGAHLHDASVGVDKSAIAAGEPLAQRRLITGGTDHFLPYLSEAFTKATHVDLAVAFVKTTGLRLLLPDLEAAVDAAASRHLRVLTSDYLDITDPEALRLLMLLQERGAEVRVHTTQDGSFHLKAYIFSRLDQHVLVAGTAFIGSSNISRQALQDGLEWNYRVVYPGDAGFLEARQRFEELFSHPRSVPLSDVWIEAYERRRLPPARAVAPGSHEQETPPEPTHVQHEALVALAACRESGYRRGLVVLATGLGKTWLAAFDAVRTGARRILFVAHREEILGRPLRHSCGSCQAGGWATTRAAAGTPMSTCSAPRCRRWRRPRTWSGLCRSTSTTLSSTNSTMRPRVHTDGC